MVSANTLLTVCIIVEVYSRIAQLRLLKMLCVCVCVCVCVCGKYDDCDRQIRLYDTITAL